MEYQIVNASPCRGYIIAAADQIIPFSPFKRDKSGQRVNRPFAVFITSVLIGAGLLPGISFSQQADLPSGSIESAIMNPAFVEENQEPPHVPLVVFDDIEDALTGDWNWPPWYHSLNGTWKFRWHHDPSGNR